MLGRELIRDYLANEARTAATQTTSQANRLASASHLWEKANQIFANADIFNLDARQTLVGVFDDIREHATKYVRPMTGMR